MNSHYPILDDSCNKRYKEMLRLIKRLGIMDKVVLHDPVPYGELPDFIKAADCVVVPSLAEGFGFAAAEACAMKKPVVASNTTSLPEVVSGKYVLVRPRDPGAIAIGVDMVKNGREAKTKLKRFELGDNIDKYLGVYRRLAG